MFKGQQLEMAKSYVKHSAVLAFMAANGYAMETEQDVNRATIAFLNQLSESVEADEDARREKERKTLEAKERTDLANKRETLADYQKEKSEAVKLLDDSIHRIVNAIPDDERTEAEQALLTVRKVKATLRRA